MIGRKKSWIKGLSLAFAVFFSIYPSVTTYAAITPTTSPSHSSAAQSADQIAAQESFLSQNDILYFNPCTSGSSSTPTATSTAASATGGATTPGSGGSCGEEGYGSGKRDSQANKQQIYSFFKGKGLSDNAISGIMGNMEIESAFMPDAVNPGGCTGIVQWCGGRNTAMRNYAAETGKDWNCLGTQLEFIWNEVSQTGESSVMTPLNGATSPSDAATIWANMYERMKPSEIAGRAPAAEKLFQEFNGSPATSLGSSSGSSASSTSGCPSSSGASSTTGSTALGKIPEANCQATQTEMQQLLNSGKILFDKNTLIQQDVDHCSTGPISCGTGNSQGGANPNTLRGLEATATNSGANSITLWNINSGHPCDEYDHPRGLASDIKQVDGVDCSSDTEQCKKAFDYLIANKDQLGVSYLIWDGSYCQQMAATHSFVTCQSDHNDHIHTSWNPAS